MLLALTVPVCAGTNTQEAAASTDSIPTIEQVDKMTGRNFENLVFLLLENQGYKVEALKGANDYGIDMVAVKDGERIAVQVKRSKYKIPRGPIAETRGSLEVQKCTRGMLVTNNGFTKNALHFASTVATNCILIDRPIIIEWLDQARGGRSPDTPESTSP
jgi:HJR/Mrr/RecB family endonuclease